MNALEDDIARIAALRGQSADAYIDANRSAQAIAMRIGPAAVRRSFVLSERPRDDYAVFDLLPPLSRQLLRESPVPINSIAYWDLLEQADGNEQALIALYRACIPLQASYNARRHYGRDHPHAQASQGVPGNA